MNNYSTIKENTKITVGTANKILTRLHEKPYGRFNPGWRMTAKKWHFVFYGKVQTSLNVSIDGLQPTFRYQLRVIRDPHNFSLGHVLV